MKRMSRIVGSVLGCLAVASCAMRPSQSAPSRELVVWEVSVKTTDWKAMPESVRREALPHHLEGRIAEDKRVLQAEGYAAQAVEDAVRFEVVGSVTQERTMRWTQPASPQPAAFYRLRYAAHGIRHSHAVFPVIAAVGRNAAGAVATHPLLSCDQTINDDLPHVVLGRLPEGFTPESFVIEVSTTDSQAALTVWRIECLSAMPQDDPAFAAADADGSLASVFSSYATVDLSAQYNDTRAAALERVIQAYGVAVDAAPRFASERLRVAGVPFRVRTTGNDIFRASEDRSILEETVPVFGEPVPRKYFFPPERKDMIEVPIGRAASEVFFILVGEFPASVNQYGRPTVPFHIDDIEAFAVELVYADGASEFAFPYSFSDGGFILRRMTGAYAVPSDPSRRLERLRLHHRTWGMHFSLAAVTVNTSHRRTVAAFAAPEVLRTPQRPDPAPAAPFITSEGNTVRCGNGFYTLTLDTSDGFRITQIAQRWSPECAIALDAESGLEAVVSGQRLTGRDLRVTTVSVTGRSATFNLEPKDAAVPLRLTLSVTVDDTPQIAFGGSVSNTGTTPISVNLRFPVLKGLQVGALEDTWVFFPKYRAFIGNQPCYHDATNDRSFPLQVFDVYNPKAGVGLAVLTHNLSNRSLRYFAGKDASGVTAGVAYPSAFTPVAPGGATELVETRLIAHTGDWHAALSAYRDWLRTWYQPHQAANREWFDRLALLRSEALADKNARRIFKTPAFWTGRPGEFRLDEVMKINREYCGGTPDMVHLYDWFHTADGEESSWGDYDFTPEGGGGVVSIRALRDALQDRFGAALSLYTIPDRASIATRAGKTYGERYVARRSDGSAEKDATAWYMCPDNAEWRAYFVQMLQRVQKESGARAMYIDVFSFYDGHQCYSTAHGHESPVWVNKATHALIKAAREALPPDVVLWSEYPLADVATQYTDGAIAYYYLTLHTLFADTYDRTESAPAAAEMPLNAYRFALPWIKQLCFPVGIEHDRNWGKLKALFFNGDPLEDCTWRLYNDRGRALLQRSLAVKRRYLDCFSSRAPEMLVPTEAADVLANRFPGDGRIAWTLFNARNAPVKGTVLAVDHRDGATYRDAWNDIPLTPTIRNGKAFIALTLDPQGLGCVVQEGGNAQ